MITEKIHSARTDKSISSLAGTVPKFRGFENHVAEMARCHKSLTR